MSLTQIGVHDKEVEVLLQVTAVFGNLSSEQVEHGPQQVVAQVVAALAGRPGAAELQIKPTGRRILPRPPFGGGGGSATLPDWRVRARQWARGRARLAARSGR